MRFLLLGTCFLFTACYLNERGISATYYNDCKAYYDAAGVYHKACDENIIDFSDAKKLVTKKQTQADMALAAAKSAEERELAEIDRLEADLEKEEEEKRAWRQRMNNAANSANSVINNAAVDTSGQNYQNMTGDKINPIDEERDFGSANVTSSATSSQNNTQNSGQNELRSSDF